MNLSVQTRLFIWGGVTLAVFLALVITKRRNRQSFPADSQWLGLPLSTLGTLVGLQTLFQAFLLPELHEILDMDGSVALAIGGGWAAYLGVNEIRKLFLDQPSPSP